MRMKSYVKQILKAVAEVNKRIVKDIALDFQSVSMSRAPLDEGDLRGSAGVSDVTIEDGETVCYMGYATVYARRMHEDLTYTPQHEGTGPKYIENPGVENAKKWKTFIIKEQEKAVSNVTTV